MKIICIGDSCTYGQGVRSSEAWPAVLERLTGHDVRNAGVCGDTTRLGLERFPRDVQLHRPDVVVLQFLANDVNCWATDNGQPRISREAYAANLWEMDQRARAAGAPTVLILGSCAGEPCQMAYVERLWEYWHCAKKAKFRTALRFIDPPRASFLADGYGVHPDPAMHERYAELVAAAL